MGAERRRDLGQPRRHLFFFSSSVGSDSERRFHQVVTHSATFDFWPAMRHALRATPHGERPISVTDYERTTGKRARDRQLDLWERQGIQLPEQRDPPKIRGYND